MIKNQGIRFRIFISCLCAAFATVFILTCAVNSARARVAEQYVAPDYVRYISQGYQLETVSTKKSYLFSVTDGEKLIRSHILTVDSDKNTLDVLELPRDSLIVADGFFGTLAKAYDTEVYSSIVSRAFCIKLSGEFSFDTKTLGDCAEMLGSGRSEEVAEKALDCYSLIRGDIIAQKEYLVSLSEIFKGLCERGALNSFTLLMNLIVNKVQTDMTVEEIIESVDMARDITLKKIQIYIAPGCPAGFDGDTVWALFPEDIAELLNNRFRIKGSEVSADMLGIPQIPAGEFAFESMPVKATDILK